MDYIDNYGLVITRPSGETEENSMLWTAQNVLLLEQTKCDQFEARKAAYNRALNLCRVSEGVYNQNPKYSTIKPSNEKDKYMSHDQLTAMCSISYKYKNNIHIEIWKELKRQKFRYDNVNPENPSWSRLQHPRDIIYIGLLNGSLICKLLKPILDVLIYLTFRKHYKVRPVWYSRIWTYLTTRTRVNKVKYVKTDGELINFVRFRCYPMGIIESISNKLIVKRFGNWKSVFSTYFVDEEHPNNKLARKANI